MASFLPQCHSPPLPSIALGTYSRPPPALLFSSLWYATALSCTFASVAAGTRRSLADGLCKCVRQRELADWNTRGQQQEAGGGRRALQIQFGDGQALARCQVTNTLLMGMGCNQKISCHQQPSYSFDLKPAQSSYSLPLEDLLLSSGSSLPSKISSSTQSAELSTYYLLWHAIKATYHIYRTAACNDTPFPPLSAVLEEWEPLAIIGAAPVSSPHISSQRPLAVISVAGDSLLVTLRGAQSAFDWVSAFQFDLTPHPSPVAAVVSRPGQVHRGLWKMSVGVVEGLVEFIERRRAQGRDVKRVILAGHSLGGAVASLVGYELSYLYKQQTSQQRLEVDVVTFGAPRLGDEEFMSDYGRVVNSRALMFELDVIPGLPCVDMPTCGAASIVPTQTCAKMQNERAEYAETAGAIEFELEELPQHSSSRWRGGGRLAAARQFQANHDCVYTCYLSWRLFNERRACDRPIGAKSPLNRISSRVRRSRQGAKQPSECSD
eukprot:GHVS01083122.1.p1 GENE.GHVS01083122.1~~GHVS01083122.1.p1  ORF type:complete len:541 (-),score=148.77 GHVS01083122.1:372-1847(-)